MGVLPKLVALGEIRVFGQTGSQTDRQTDRRTYRVLHIVRLREQQSRVKKDLQ